jgi:hypothetical protein
MNSSSWIRRAFGVALLASVVTGRSPAASAGGPPEIVLFRVRVNWVGRDCDEARLFAIYLQ